MSKYSDNKAREVIDKLLTLLERYLSDENIDQFLNLYKANTAVDMLQLTSLSEEEPEEVKKIIKGEREPIEFAHYLEQLTEDIRQQTMLASFKRGLQVMLNAAKVEDAASKNEAASFIEKVTFGDISE